MGIVGQAQARMFRAAVTFDVKAGVPYPREQIGACDLAVICAGTPPLEDGRANTDFVAAAVDALQPQMPALIRSTVPPGTTDAIAAGRPGPVCHAPEFLYEGGSGPWREAADVPWMLLGGTPGARAFFAPVLASVFPGTIRECAALEAELAKYTANLYWAARVTFVNEMAAVADAFGAGWEQVRRLWLLDERVSPAHTAMEGFAPGFGGRCWPKDLSALIAAAEDAGYKPGFLPAVAEANARFRG